jgi:hypothetical protein
MHTLAMFRPHLTMIAIVLACVLVARLSRMDRDNAALTRGDWAISIGIVLLGVAVAALDGW